MEVKDLDRAELKALVKEIMMEDISLFKEAIKDILMEYQVIVNEEQVERRKRLEQMINADFDKYDEVFRALA